MNRREMMGLLTSGAAALLHPGWAWADEAPQADGLRIRRLKAGWQVLSVAYAPDGSLLASGGADRIARFWDAHTGTLKRLLPEEC